MAEATRRRGKGRSEVLVLMCIACFQPITRIELSSFFGREISRDLIGNLRSAGLIASGPRSPTPGVPYTYITSKVLIPMHVAPLFRNDLAPLFRELVAP